MDKNKKKEKALKQEMSNYSIEIKEFLVNYCAIYNTDLFSTRISHKDIKVLFPNLRRVSFDSLKSDMSSLYNGNVIAVRDLYGQILPYKNPKVISTGLEYDDVITQSKQLPENKPNKINNSVKGNLSIQELLILRSQLKRYKKIQEFRIVSKKLKIKMREEEYCKVKQYKKEKFDLVLKGREEND